MHDSHGEDFSKNSQKLYFFGAPGDFDEGKKEMHLNFVLFWTFSEAPEFRWVTSLRPIVRAVKPTLPPSGR